MALLKLFDALAGASGPLPADTGSFIGQPAEGQDLTGRTGPIGESDGLIVNAITLQSPGEPAVDVSISALRDTESGQVALASVPSADLAVAYAQVAAGYLMPTPVALIDQKMIARVVYKVREWYAYRFKSTAHWTDYVVHYPVQVHSNEFYVVIEYPHSVPNRLLVKVFLGRSSTNSPYVFFEQTDTVNKLEQILSTASGWLNFKERLVQILQREIGQLFGFEQFELSLPMLPCAYSFEIVVTVVTDGQEQKIVFNVLFGYDLHSGAVTMTLFDASQSFKHVCILDPSAIDNDAETI